MIRLCAILIIAIFSLNVYSQQQNAKYVTIPTYTTKYGGGGVSNGTIVTNLETSIVYLVIAYAGPTESLSTTSKEPFGAATTDNFNGDRYVTRPGVPNINVGGTIDNDWLNNYFFPFINPTISCNGTSPYEIGTDNNVTISGAVTLHSETSVTDGKLRRESPDPADILAFGTDESYSTGVVFNPRQGGTITQTYKAYTTGIDCGCTVNSSLRTITSHYPYFCSISLTDLSGGGALLYTTLDKLAITSKSNKTVYLADSGYIYFAYPYSYGQLDIIRDKNGYDITESFYIYSNNVTSSGLPGNWTENYYIYKTKTTTEPENWPFTFSY